MGEQEGDVVAGVTRCVDRLQPHHRVGIFLLAFLAEGELLAILYVSNQVLALPNSFLIYCCALIIIRVSLKLRKPIEYILLVIVIIQVFKYLWFVSLTTIF